MTNPKGLKEMQMKANEVARHEVAGKGDDEMRAQEQEADHEARIQRAARLLALGAIRVARARHAEEQAS